VTRQLTLPNQTHFQLTGAEGRRLVGSTTTPNAGTASARALALVVHGWTGNKDRNIVPAAGNLLHDLDCVVHRITLAHAGVEPHGDRIVDADAFERDRLDNATTDVRAAADAIRTGALEGGHLPWILVGHSRGGAQVLRIAATAARESWPLKPAAVVALAPVSRHGHLHPKEREAFDRDGFVERPCARAPAGKVRMGTSWFQHWIDEPDRDHFAQDVADLACPTLVVHGEADTSVGLDHADRIQSLAQQHDKADWTFARIPHADHNFGAKGFLGERLDYDPSLLDALRGAVADFLDRALAP